MAKLWQLGEFSSGGLKIDRYSNLLHPLPVWHDLGVALCLVLVIEGILPFLYPKRWREMVTMLSEVDDRAMRVAGLPSLLLGTGMLYLIN